MVIVPPGGVNFRAFDSRLLNTRFIFSVSRVNVSSSANWQSR